MDFGGRSSLATLTLCWLGKLAVGGGSGDKGVVALLLFLGWEESLVPRDEEDQHAKRKELTKKRDEIYERFFKAPAAIHLAFEIKALDDKISECTELIRQKRAADKEGRL
jgi:hypothetical protein